MQDFTSDLFTKMLFQSPTFVAFSILSFSSYISTSVAGHTYAHHHHLQAHRHEARIASRADSGFVQVPLSELHLLQTETSAFQDWMTTWIDMESQTDRESSVALLQQEIQAYQGWMRAWLDAVSTPGGPTTIPLPSSVPVTLPLSSSLELSTSRIDVPATSIKPSSLVTSSSSVSVSASILPTAAGEFFLRHLSASNPTLNASSGIAPSQTSFVTLVSPKPTKASISTVPVLTSRPPAIIPVPVVSAPPPVSSEAVHGSGGPFSGFNPQSSRNLAVYYGQTAATGQTSLGDLCKNENVDIVILAFLTDFFGAGGFPKVNFGPACGGQTAAMQSAGASGLLSCPDMASQISQCQSLGKKVLLSLGGSLATSAFSSDSQASGFATKLWDLFGAGTGIDPGLRPFGDVKVDGFDVGEFWFLFWM